MCVDIREWDVDIIRDIFNIRDKESILNPRIQDNNLEDSMYWKWHYTINCLQQRRENISLSAIFIAIESMATKVQNFGVASDRVAICGFSNEYSTI